MSQDVVTPNGITLFAERDGEIRIPWSVLVEAPAWQVAAFQTALRRYIDEHPRLKVAVLDHFFEDELVIKWRWQGVRR